MTSIPESSRARRYLLGEANEEESALLEQEYFEREETGDGIEAAEEELIEDYLSGQLSAVERDRFERVYLSAPHRRVRVETIRRLTTQGSQSSAVGAPQRPAVSQRPLMRPAPWLALAASLLVVASAALWFFSSFNATRGDVVDNRAAVPPASPVSPDGTPGAPANVPRVFALTLSSVAVRGASNSPGTVIPPDTDIVVIRLESDGENRKLTASRASVRAVAGQEVWRGRATAESDGAATTVARIDVPVVNVPPEDYLITLFGTDTLGAEMEWAQYFLRVRAR